jgi:hypothetical protein
MAMPPLIRRLRVGLLARFALASLVAVVLLGVVLAHTLAGEIRQRALANARQSAQLIDQSLVQPQLQVPGDDLAGAAVDHRHQIAPAVLGDPDRGHVELPQLPRPLDPEEAGPLPPLRWTPTLDQRPFPHHPEHPLAVDRDPQLLPGQRRDHR